MRKGVKVRCEFTSADGKLHVSFDQIQADKHPLQIVCAHENDDFQYELELSEDDLHNLFYWLTMHMSNCNRIRSGLGSMPIWDGELHTHTRGKAEAALRLADDRKTDTEELEREPGLLRVKQHRARVGGKPKVQIGQLGLGELMKDRIRR